MKGAGGPVLLSGLRAILHSLAATGLTLPDLFGELNRTLWTIAPENTFTSLFSARICPRLKRIDYINASPEAALLIRPEGKIERLESSAAVLGLSRRSPYHQRTVAFEPGDTLVALTEANDDGNLSFIRDAVPAHFEDLPPGIVRSAETSSGVRALDRTVVAVRFDDPGERFAGSEKAKPHKPLAAAA